MGHFHCSFYVFSLLKIQFLELHMIENCLKVFLHWLNDFYLITKSPLSQKCSITFWTVEGDNVEFIGSLTVRAKIHRNLCSGLWPLQSDHLPVHFTRQTSESFLLSCFCTTICLSMDKLIILPRNITSTNIYVTSNQWEKLFYFLICWKKHKNVCL